MELRSRSRSKTPFIQKNSEDDDTDQYNGSNKRILTRSRKSTNIIHASEHYITSSSSTMNVKKTRKSYKTSDYSSEDGESDWKHITENQRNQIIEDAKAAANGNTKISALDLYRKAGRYWDKYPKTDWTYSPHSKDRVEIAPGVVQMPNMSRPTIHSYESSTNTDLTFSQYSRYNQGYHQNWLYRCINYIKYLFSSTNTATISSETTSIDESDFIKRKSTTKRSLFSYVSTIFLTIFSIFYYFYYLQNSLIVWFGKQLHHFTSRLMLIDTWLLMKRRNSGSKINRLIVLCFLPLIIFAGWWLLSAIGNTILTYFSNNGNSTSPLLMATTTPTTTLSPILEEIEDNSMGRKPEFSPPQFTTKIDDEIIDKILNNPKISKLINDNIDRDSNENYRTLLLIIDELKQEINRVNRKLIDVEKFHTDDLNRISIEYQTENIKNYARLSAELKRCCYRSNFVNIESYTTRILHDLLNNREFLLKQHGLNQYFRNLFVTQHELELKLSNLTRNLSNDYNPTIEQTAKTIMDRIVDKIDTSQLSDKKINELIQENLKIYDADKTGLVDYAMESMGGQIITTRCTETYNGGTRVFSIFNIPLWYQPNTPRIVITPSIHPGECWAFQNFPGFLVVKLSNRIRIEAFTIEHVSRLLVPNQRIDSAPKEFEVYGLNDESDPEPVLIGQYVYDYNGDSMQYFIAQQSALVYDMVELRVKSNHGNPNYTCLYRFRVHGTTVEQT